MKVVVGSKNKTKVGACGEGLETMLQLTSLSVPSGVAAQPFSMMKRRCKERSIEAKRALEEGEAQIGIGLEGGVMKTEHGLFMCNWGALVNK